MTVRGDGSLSAVPPSVTRGDISGAFADLGVLVPLEASLVAINGLNPTVTLTGIGLAYCLAAAYFRIPMPVQPLKAFAAIAIAGAVSPKEIAAGGLIIGALMGLLALTGGIGLLQRVTPGPVVRGIQLGLGMILGQGGFQLIFQRPFLLNGTQVVIDVGFQRVPVGVLLGASGLLLLVLLLRRPVVPPALALLALGAVVGIVMAPEGDLTSMRLGPADWRLVLPEAADFWAALWLLVIPQIPLSLANAVLSTADVARTYFGEQARRVTPKALALSYSFANLAAGAVGGLPMCHGAGGLTAHYRLGARTPTASYIIGVTLIIVGWLFGQSATAIRSVVPSAVLGALLLYVGWEHLRLGFEVPNRRDLAFVFLTAAASMVAGGNLAVGALVGFAAFWVARGLSHPSPHPSPAAAGEGARSAPRPRRWERPAKDAKRPQDG